jgi:hypothetical protein
VCRKTATWRLNSELCPGQGKGFCEQERKEIAIEETKSFVKSLLSWISHKLSFPIPQSLPFPLVDLCSPGL